MPVPVCQFSGIPVPLRCLGGWSGVTFQCYGFGVVTILQCQSVTKGMAQPCGLAGYCYNVTCFWHIEYRQTQATTFSASANRITYWAIRDTQLLVAVLSLSIFTLHYNITSFFLS